MKNKSLSNSLLNSESLRLLLSNKSINGYSEEIAQELEKIILDYISNKTKEIKNRSRIVKNDSEKDQLPALTNLTDKQIKSLPGWVKSDLANAQIIGSSKKVVKTIDGKKYHLSNPLNSLSGGQWTYFLNSVVNTRYSTSGAESYAHHIRKVHPSPKPPQLMREIIEFFTKEDELVFDYFMGVGGTLIGASLSGRKCIGIDLNQKYIDAYKEANKYLNLEEQQTFLGDSIQILKNKKTMLEIFGNKKASLILIDPPYGDMMAREKTGETLKKKGDASPTPYTNLSADLGNMELHEFYKVFKSSVENSLSILKDKGHLVVFIKDLQPKGKELNLLHADLIASLNEIEGLYYLGTKIWADQGVNLYPYGYPFAYVSNQIHQYILIFKKK
jgi:DNA modification methylase